MQKSGAVLDGRFRDARMWAIAAVTAMASIACSAASPRRASKRPAALIRSPSTRVWLPATQLV
jgi:hypothetical protein